MEIIVIALLIFIAVQEYFNRKERQRLVEAFLAKNLTEVRDLEAVRNIKPTKPSEQDNVDMVSELSDKEFDKFIKKNNELEE